MPFQPGNPGGPGRPPIPEDVREARKLNRGEIDIAISKFAHMTLAQLIKAKNDPEATMLELMVISIMNQSVKRGDHQRLGWFIEQVLGKMANKVQVDIEHQQNININIERRIFFDTLPKEKFLQLKAILEPES